MFCILLQVNVAMVIKTLQSNGEKAKKLILAAVPLIAQEDWTETLQQNKVLRCHCYYF